MTRSAAALALLLLASCTPGPGKKPEGEQAHRTVGEVPFDQRLQAQKTALEALWTAEARTLALQHEAPATVAGVGAADTSQWGSETESRLRALLMPPGPARTWAAFGLGLRCPSKPERILSALTPAAANWAVEAEGISRDLFEVMAWSIGACGTLEAEKTLASWLDAQGRSELSALSDAAVVGLGVLADRRRELTEQTQAALLDAAVSEKKSSRLYPLSRLARVHEAVGARLLDVAGGLLADKDQDRRTIILSLASAGPLASRALGQVLLSRDYAPAERSAAAQALSRLGSDGQKVLDETLRDLLRRGLPTKAESDLWAPLRATLLAVDLPTLAVGELQKLTTLGLPEADEPLARAQRRRLLWLRCRAADLVARDRSLSASLLSCDPDGGEVFQLAQINVLGRSRIEAQRVKVFETLAQGDNPRVAQAALRLIPGHPELRDVSDLLAQALATSNVGTQATAAKIIAAYPIRAAHPGATGPNEKVVLALRHLLESGQDAPEETQASVITAAGALGALTLKPALEPYCDGPRPGLHLPAQRALALLGNPKRVCGARLTVAAPSTPTTAPPPAAATAPSPAAEAPLAIPSLLIELESDFGKHLLRLDAKDAPLARKFVADLARSGQLTRHPVHQTSAGSAVQFGDPDGDGYDNTRAPLDQVELSPQPFGPYSVGISGASEDTPGSQLFVTLAAAPQFRGRRVLLGSAEGPWDLLWPGDPLRLVQVSELPPISDADLPRQAPAPPR